ELAAAYIEATGKSLASYAELLAGVGEEFLLTQPEFEEQQRRVGTTWSLAFEQVSRSSPAGAAFMNLISFLAPDEIPLDLLAEQTEALPLELGGGAKLDEAVAALRRYSLIDLKGVDLSVHRLVQATTRAQLDAEGLRRWAGAAVELVNAALPFDSDEVPFWETCRRLTPHALVSASHAQSAKAGSESSLRVLSQIGLYLASHGELRPARDADERAVALAEEAYGPDHPVVATVLSNLAVVLRQLGEVMGARQLLERAL